MDHRGSDPFSAFQAAALVGLACARAMTGKLIASVEAYTSFLGKWKAADTDVPFAGYDARFVTQSENVIENRGMRQN